MSHYGLDETKPVSTPIVKEDQRLRELRAAALTAEKASAHRHAVGQHMFVGLDRADVQFTVKKLGREMAQPTGADDTRARRCVRYLRDRPSIRQSLR